MPSIVITPLTPDGTKQDPITYPDAEASQDASTGLLTVVLHGRRADREVTVEFPREQYADWKEEADTPAPAPSRRSAASVPVPTPTPEPATGDEEKKP
jgi:hypothetical protein